MEKTKIIFADEDEEYIYSVIGRFIQEQGEQLEIEAVTRKSYWKSLSAQPFVCDLLIIREDWYEDGLIRQNIGCICLLCEREEAAGEHNPGIRRIYKYTSLKEIYLQVTSGTNLAKSIRHEEKRTGLLAVYSAVGGSGKTTLALGLSAALNRHGSRVLYVNLENMQSFDYFLEDRSCVGPEDSSQAYGPGWSRYVRTQGFDYLPPRRQPAAADPLSFLPLIHALEQAGSRGQYDYFVMELPAGPDAERIQVLNKADRILLVTGQDALAVWKTERFLENIDYSDQEKFLFVCNASREEAENFAQRSPRFCLGESIPYLQDKKEISSVGGMLQSSLFDRLVYLVY